MTPLGSLARLFDGAAVRYAVIGAHAVNVWLEPRFTADIDVTVHVAPGDLDRLEHAFAAAGYARTRAHGVAAPSGPDFLRFVSADGQVVVEIQTAKTALQREVVGRARTAGDGVRVATPEDLIVLKLIADRPKDRADLAGLVLLPSLDWPYVERWAGEWDVLDRLDRLRPRTP